MATNATALPPKVRGWPVIGSLPELWRHDLDFLLAMRRRHGDVFRLDFGDAEITLLGHPRHAAHVLRGNAANYLDKGSVKGFRAGHYPLMQQGLATVSGRGEAWRHQRLAVQPHFRPKHMASFAEVMTAAIEETMARWRDDELTAAPLDLEREMTRMTMNVIGHAMFGTAIAPQEADRIAASVRYTFAYTWWATLGQTLPGWVPLPGKRRYRRAIADVYDQVWKIAARSIDGDGGGDGDHLVGHLWRQARQQGDDQAARAFVRMQAVTIVITGYESTAAALSWAFHLLPRHPPALDRLRREIDAVLGGRRPTFADLPRLIYARQVLQETLRLYAPSHWIQRTAEEEDRIDGFRIPAGSIVAPMIHLIHHHPELWPRPERFDPDRFAPAASAGRDPLAWIPFGSGPRMCLAEELAMTKTTLILASVLQRFDLAAVPGREPTRQVGTNVRPRGGVWARLAAREG